MSLRRPLCAKMRRDKDPGWLARPTDPRNALVPKACKAMGTGGACY